MNQMFRLISDDKSLALFNTVALLEPATDILTSKVQLTTKQYYSRIYNLTACGLIKRHNGKYYLTSLGKVAYEIQLKIGKAVNNSGN
jgi:predicted transcriptional regulator